MIRIVELTDRGDRRGGSFSPELPQRHFLGRPLGVHATTLRPGAIRGNHFHVERFEVLLVHFDGPWSLHWDDGAGTSRKARSFEGTGLVQIEIPPGVAHAVRNDGSDDVWIVALSNGEFDAATPDAVRRMVVDPPAHGG